MPRHLLPVLLALLVAGPALASRDFTEAEKQKMRALAKEYRERLGWQPESVNVEAAIAHVQQRARSETGRIDVGPWLQEALTLTWWSWIPREPKPQYEFLYGFPLDVRTPRRVLAAEEKGEITLLAPKGTPVLAVRDGTVARVTDGFTQCCRPSSQAFQTNRVFVVHEDGTVARYQQLRAGVRVKQGEKIARGQRIGLTSDAGATQLPGLVFALWRWNGKATEMMDVRFEGKQGEGLRAEAGGRLHAPLPSELRLAGFIDGERLRRKGANREVKPGESLRIRLRHVPRRGEPRDVTTASKTRFDTSTPWLVEVLGNRVTFRRKDWPGMPEGNTAIVRALYEDPDAGKSGYVDLEFDVAP